MNLKQLSDKQTKEWIGIFNSFKHQVDDVSNIVDDICNRKEKQYRYELKKTLWRRMIHDDRLGDIKESIDYAYACSSNRMYMSFTALSTYDIAFTEDEIEVIRTHYIASRKVKEVAKKLIIFMDYASQPFTVTEEDVLYYMSIKELNDDLESIKKKHMIYGLPKTKESR